MDAKIKVAAFVIFYTIATVAAYCVLFAFGPTDDLDWRFWLGCSPQAGVTLVFGYLSSGWKQVLAFSLTTCFIDMTFIGTTYHFSPEIWQSAVARYDSMQLFAVIALIFSFLLSFLLVGLGYLTAVSKRSITRSFLK